VRNHEAESRPETWRPPKAECEAITSTRRCTGAICTFRKETIPESYVRGCAQNGAGHTDGRTPEQPNAKNRRVRTFIPNGMGWIEVSPSLGTPEAEAAAEPVREPGNVTSRVALGCPYR
jgi:hypothetical protein